MAREPLGEVLPFIDADQIERSLRRVLATAKPVADLEVSSHAGDCGGERIWSCLQLRIDGPDGEAAVACMMREVTERASNQRRLALVDEASTRIGTTLDITRTAEELLDVATASLADAAHCHADCRVLAPRGLPSIKQSLLCHEQVLMYRIVFGPSAAQSDAVVEGYACDAVVTVTVAGNPTVTVWGRDADCTLIRAVAHVLPARAKLTRSLDVGCCR